MMSDQWKPEYEQAVGFSLRMVRRKIAFKPMPPSTKRWWWQRMAEDEHNKNIQQVIRYLDESGNELNPPIVETYESRWIMDETIYEDGSHIEGSNHDMRIMLVTDDAGVPENNRTDPKEEILAAYVKVKNTFRPGPKSARQYLDESRRHEDRQAMLRGIVIRNIDSFIDIMSDVSHSLEMRSDLRNHVAENNSLKLKDNPYMWRYQDVMKQRLTDSKERYSLLFEDEDWKPYWLTDEQWLQAKDYLKDNE